jgi:hypothetical protein
MRAPTYAMRRFLLPWLPLLGLIPAPIRGATAPFDLVAPPLGITVTREGVSLPLAQVPHLQPGDRLRIEEGMPTDQSARYMLVLAFLRGATNPPPKDWLFRAAPWKAKSRSIDVVVPTGAQQALAFLVPRTRGAFATVVNAVRGHPGVFVRASQELNQAGLDRARVDAFLAGVRRSDSGEPGRLANVSPLLARSLAIKFDASCLLRQPELQAACLTQGSEALVLADTPMSSLADTIAGAPTDLALQLSRTPEGGHGYFSPYIGVLRDIANLLGAFHSPRFQYIPALRVPRNDANALLLNAVPSFAKPQSVLVAALPPVAPLQMPVLPSGVVDAPLCASRPDLTLPVDATPLFYATGYARALFLRVRGKEGQPFDLPVDLDPVRGGVVLTRDQVSLAGLGEVADAQLHGFWGFQAFDGPRYRLLNPQGRTWQVANGATLVVGRETPLEMRGGVASCVVDISIGTGVTAQIVAWEPKGEKGLLLRVPGVDMVPGPVTLLVQNYGIAEPQRISLQAYAEESRITGFTLHAGDRNAVLDGTRLDQVASVEFGGISFNPGELTRSRNGDRLAMSTTMAAVGMLQPGQVRQARVILLDGRSVEIGGSVAAPRPAVALVGKTVERIGPSDPISIRLNGPDLFTQNDRLTFALQALGSTRFSSRDTIEIAADEEGRSASIGLRLQDSRVAVASIEPGAALGTSAFGPLRFRIVQDGVAGDWQPLGTLVRLPAITQIACPAVRRSCRLTGRSLFLLRSVSTRSVSGDRVTISDGFTGTDMDVPRPAGEKLFLELRDDPHAIAQLIVPH